MRKRFGDLATLAIVGIVILTILGAGIISFDWPWADKVASRDTTVLVESDQPPTVFKVEPISITCSSRIYAEVPLTGRTEHRLFGQVYRTDTVDMTAYGDVDTCVRTSDVKLTESGDGSITVIIPAEAIEFVRPRVDATETAGSVEFDKGLLGKFTDAFPWVSDDNDLTELAYAFAQETIGGSQCMEAAYDITEDLLTDGYRNQLAEQGADPNKVDVTIDGQPDFDQNDSAIENPYDFNVNGDEVVCEVADNALITPADDVSSEVR